MSNGWETSQSFMTRRYEFASYPETRAFLDRLAEYSKERGYYPDLNFGKNHVNVSITSENPDRSAFAVGVDALVQG
ncbi:MAG: 4a-hydroxytetrahydrobiopterin dehydratase [Burkholderiales bacterium]